MPAKSLRSSPSRSSLPPIPRPSPAASGDRLGDHPFRRASGALGAGVSAAGADAQARARDEGRGASNAAGRANEGGDGGEELRSPGAHLAAKRCVDVGVALVVLLTLAPLLLLLFVLVRRGDGGPALFRQMRVGRSGRHFACYKFRSMVPDAEQALVRHLRANPEAAREWAETQKLTNDPRVTRLGLFLRRTSLDELPQIINVLAGDMSLVGPRPIVPTECARYGEDIAYYLAVRPGITGLWQVSGRSDCSYEERVALDIAYARGWRLHHDVVILLRTIPAVLLQRGSR